MGPDPDGEFGRLDVTVGGDTLDGVALSSPALSLRDRTGRHRHWRDVASIRPQQVQLAAPPAAPEQGMPAGAVTARS